MPSDVITVAGKAWVINCIFKDIYGACVHGSATNTASAKGVVIENCQFDNVCLSTPTQHGHGPSVGVYLQSNLTRDIQMLNCRIENNSGYVVNYLSEGLVLQGNYVKTSKGIFAENVSSTPRAAPRVIGNAFIDAGNLWAGGFTGNEHLHNGIVISGNYFKNSAIRVTDTRHATITNNSFEFDSSYQTRFSAGEIQDLQFNSAVVLGGEVTFTGNRLINASASSASLQRGVYMMGFDAPATSYMIASNTVQGFNVGIENAVNTGTEVTPWGNVCSIIGNSITLPDVAGTRRGVYSLASGVTISGNTIHSLRTLAAQGIYASGANNDTTSGAIGCKVLNNIVTGCQYWLVTEWYCNVIDGNTFEGTYLHQDSSTRQTFGINTSLTTSGVDRKTETTTQSLIVSTSASDNQLIIDSADSQGVRFLRPGVGNWIIGRAADNKFHIAKHNSFDGTDDFVVIDTAGNVLVKGSAAFATTASDNQVIVEAADSQGIRFLRPGVGNWIAGRAADNKFHIAKHNSFNGTDDFFVIDTAGNVAVKGSATFAPQSSVTLSTNGEFSIEMTSNTDGNLVYRGSDGTTRRMALTFS
jgi:hypothetical protein